MAARADPVGRAGVARAGAGWVMMMTNECVTVNNKGA